MDELKDLEKNEATKQAIKSSVHKFFCSEHPQFAISYFCN